MRANAYPAAAWLVLLELVFPCGSLVAQSRAPDFRRYSLASEADELEALWVNPAGLAVRPGWAILLQTRTGARDVVEDIVVEQVLLGARLGGFAFGYRHDEFAMGERILRAQGDAFTAGLGLGTPALALGAAHTWHRVGLPESVWDVGLLWRPVSWLSLGAAWWDLGSPAIGGVQQEERVALAASVRPLRERVTFGVQSELATEDGRVVRHIAGLRVLTAMGLEPFAAIRLNDDFNLDDLTLGFRLLGSRGETRWAVHRERGGDRTGYLGTSTFYGDANRRVLEGPAKRALSATTAAVPPSASTPLGLYAALFKPPSRRILRVTLEGEYVDYRPPGFALFAAEDRAAQPIVNALRQARDDRTVRGLLLRIRPLSGGFLGPVTALHQELRAEIEQLRGAGKVVVAYLDVDVAGPSELYLASVADEIVAPRLAVVRMPSVDFWVLRLRRTFERFGIEWDTAMAGQYKSTFHALYTDTSSSAQREWIDRLVERAFDDLVRGIAEGRGWPVDRVRALADGPPLSAPAARDSGLVDHLGAYADAERRIRERIGRKPSVEDLRLVRFRRERWGVPPTVVVVSAHGSIRTGRSRRDPIWGGVTIGSETVARQLRDAAAIPGARAVVLRVDSPGGSGVASDEIRAAVDWLREEKKLPVIASMGNAAASGGYWISMKADTIVADPLTVTGSIGVIFSFPVLEPLLDSLRVTREGWTRGRYGDLLNPLRHRSSEEMHVIRDLVGQAYDVFVEEAANGRGLAIDSVRALAGGRVWFGRDAHAVGLVDVLGGLRSAIEIAATRAGVDDEYRVVVIREEGPSLLRLIFQSVGLRDIGFGGWRGDPKPGQLTR